MTKRLFAILRYTAAVMLAASLFVFSSCDDDDEPTVFSGTVGAYIASDQFKEANTSSPDNALDSLVKYVALYPELMTALNGTAEVTLFAPSNTAFKNLLATPGFPAQISLISPDLIKGVLSYHIVSGKKMKADMTANATFSTMFTDPTAPSAAQVITVNTDGTLLTGSTNKNIDVVVADQLATNGVVQVVESVMIPPSVGASLTPILGTMAGTILLGKDFTYLARLIARADAGNTNAATTITGALAAPVASGGFQGATFFAPPNAVIEAAATAGGKSATAFIDSFTTGTTGTAYALLRNHYVMGKYVVTAATGAVTLTNGAQLTPLNGDTKKITVVTGGTVSAQNPYGVALSNTPGVQASFRPIVVKDLAHTNGYVQVFGGILM